jgi:aryl-alcohol dehydrogenase-like predicted oxidoreductase
VTFLEWRGARLSRVVLGTAQLGLDYGISNAAGKPDAAAAREIVRRSVAGGVNAFDTARAYGESERVLGDALGALPDAAGPPHVVTKIDPATAAAGRAEVEAALDECARRLAVPGEPLFCVMLHWAASMDHWGTGLGAAMVAAKERGAARSLGVSCYTAEEARRALAHPEIDAIQIPLNAWDGRMRDAGVFAEAASAGKLVFARSIFLQGLLLMRPDEVEGQLPFAAGASRAWWALAERLGFGPRELAARSALASGCPLVVGAATPEEAGENTGLAALPPLGENGLDEIREAMRPFLDARILNPATW